MFSLASQLLVYPIEQLTDKIFHMNTHEAQTVWQYVKAYRGGEIRHKFNMGQLWHFDQIAQQLRADTGLTKLAEEDLQIGIAMSWFGPADAGLPPATLREELLDLLHSDMPDETTRKVRSTEVVIAYGCGNWRQIAKGGGSW